MKNNRTILITAYAINPYWGSEQGMGWNFISNIPKEFKLIVITRGENEIYINRFIKENKLNLSNIEFHYFDFTQNSKWNKSSLTVMLHYWIWQIRVVSFIEKANFKFDICHCLNFHTDWVPSFLFKFNKPFIWGPIGHHEKIPNIFMGKYSINQLLKDRLAWGIKKYFWKYSSALKKTASSADFILTMNSKSLPLLPKPDKRLINLSSVGSRPYLNQWTINDAVERYENKRFEILCIARFVPLKGIDLVLEAFSTFLNKIDSPEYIKLKIIGKGECEGLYLDIIKNLKIEKYVNIIKWMPHEELDQVYRNSHVFLFPSHEGAGMVVVEALANGLPVICLDNDGPGEIIDEFCGFKIKASFYDEAVNEIAIKLSLMHGDRDLCMQLSVNAFKRWDSNYSWDKKGLILGNLYNKISIDENHNN